jgi:arylsulfatase A-like enzyme
LRVFDRRIAPTLFTLGVLAAVPAAADPEQPNVVIFLADDLGWADVGFHGEESIETPSIDRLAREGVQLDRFYTTPICSPTRAALMTGRDPMRLGVAYGVILPWHTIGIHPDEHFMPQSFQAAGYQTAMVGKWHLGHAQQTYHPNQRGFDHFYLPARRRGFALDPRARSVAPLLPLRTLHRAPHAARCARRPEGQVRGPRR